MDKKALKWLKHRCNPTTWKYLFKEIIRKVRKARFKSKIKIVQFAIFFFTLLGCTVQFQCRFPQELEGRLDRATFERTITKINEYFLEAEKGNCSTFCEGFCACLTAYLIYLFSETHYEKVKHDFSLLSVFINFWLTYCTWVSVLCGLKISFYFICSAWGKSHTTSPLKMSSSTIQRVFQSPIPCYEVFVSSK